MHTLRKSLFVLVLAVLALSAAAAAPLPVAAVADPVQAAIQWLHTQQLDDGGFGITGRASPAMTADVVYALALAGEDPGGPAWTVKDQSALATLAQLAPSYASKDPGQAGKVARAVAAAGRDPRSFGGMDLIAVIERAYDPATGRYHKDYLFRHAVAIEALQRASLPVPPAAYSALWNSQLPDGGWFWAFEATQSDVDTTGRVLQVLGRAPLAGCNGKLAAAASFLARAQLASGGWSDVPAPTTKPANANSTGLAVGGLRAIGRDPGAEPFVKNGQSGLQALLALQEASGAFVYTAVPGGEEYRLTATADALAGLLQNLAPMDGECRTVYLPLLLVR